MLTQNCYNIHVFSLFKEGPGETGSGSAPKCHGSPIPDPTRDPDPQTTYLEPFWIRGRPVQHLEPVPLGKAELRVVLRLEGVERHHDVHDILRHAVGVRVVYLLLGVVGREPAHLHTQADQQAGLIQILPTMSV